MASNVVIPTVNQIQSQDNRKIFEVGFPSQVLRVTFTDSPEVVAEWIANVEREQQQNFFPVGVAVKNNQGSEIAHVLTLATEEECIVINLSRGRILSRDTLVFLRDVCTSYGFQTNEYADLLVARHPRLALGRLVDIQGLVPNGSNMGISDFSLRFSGYSIPEPTCVTWTSLKKSHIRETVIEAYTCYLVGRRFPGSAPPNNSVARVFSDTYPQINLRGTTADKRTYQVQINTDERLRVTYTKQGSVLTDWLGSLGRTGRQSRLFGFDLNHDHRGRNTALAFASGKNCLVFNLCQANYEPDVTYTEIFNAFLQSDCPFVGWSTQGLQCSDLGITPGQIVDVKNAFPYTYAYDDVARYVLGYEMPKLSIVGREPEENEIMGVAVQAYVCLTAGLGVGYGN